MLDKSEQVCQREEEVYGKSFSDVHEYYRQVQRILEELGFDEIEEGYVETWGSLPLKNDILAYKYKDPFTRIRIKIKGRIKGPRLSRTESGDTIKARFVVSGHVEQQKYRYWKYFDDKSKFKKTSIYSAVKKFVQNFMDSFMFRKEWEKYKEEAEELTIEVVSQLREVIGSVEAIGKSKREWYQPDFRYRGER